MGSDAAPPLDGRPRAPTIGPKEGATNVFGRGRDKGAAEPQPNVLRGVSGWTEPNTIGSTSAASAESAASITAAPPIVDLQRQETERRAAVAASHATDPIYRVARRVSSRRLKPLLIPLALMGVAMAVAIAVPSMQMTGTLALLVIGGVGAVMYWAITISTLYVEANATRGKSLVWVLVMSLLHWHVWAALIGGLLAIWVAIAYASWIH